MPDDFQLGMGMFGHAPGKLGTRGTLIGVPDPGEGALS
jgi:hypothetical protein